MVRHKDLPEYSAWLGMNGRCNNPKNENYAECGGKGIKVCEEWQGPDGFARFRASVGARPSSKHRLCRIDLDRDFAPDNCRWTTAGNKRNRIQITANGETRYLAEWARMYGLSTGLLRTRIVEQGMDPLVAITTPHEGTRRGLKALNRSEYRSWHGMIQRCCNPTDQSYARYGGRGIRVCDEWLGRIGVRVVAGFSRFLAAMGKKPSPQHQLDRIDNNGDYSPENCHWATPAENTFNREVTIKVTFNGETHSLGWWIKKVGLLAESSVRQRVRNGMDPIKALFSPPKQIQKVNPSSPHRYGD